MKNIFQPYSSIRVAVFNLNVPENHFYGDSLFAEYCLDSPTQKNVNLCFQFTGSTNKKKTVLLRPKNPMTTIAFKSYRPKTNRTYSDN